MKDRLDSNAATGTYEYNDNGTKRAFTYLMGI